MTCPLAFVLNLMKYLHWVSSADSGVAPRGTCIPHVWRELWLGSFYSCTESPSPRIAAASEATYIQCVWQARLVVVGDEYIRSTQPPVRLMNWLD